MPEAVVAAASAVATAVTTAVTSSAFITAVATTALSFTLSAVVANNTKPEAQGGLVDLNISSAEPRRLICGKRMIGGLFTDWYTEGEKNQNLYMIAAISEGPCERITRVLLGGREIYNTPLVHGVKTPMGQVSGGERLWVTWYDGRDGQTADPYLVGRNLGWGSTAVGEGIAYVIIEAQWDLDNMLSPPDLSFEIEGATFYDRRKDTTAGGSGSHRFNDSSTWEFSANPAVILDHYLLGRYTSNGTLSFGVGLSADKVPFDNFVSNANLCDETVTERDSVTIARYEYNGFLFSDKNYSDTIKNICSHMNARPVDLGGRIYILDGEARTPVMSIDQGDLLEDSIEQYRPKRSWNGLKNAIEGRYVEPLNNYQFTDYPRIFNSVWQADDGGEENIKTLTFDSETNPYRAQRLATLNLRRQRRQAQLTATYPIWAVELEPGDWFTRTGGRFGAGKVFEVKTRMLDPNTLKVSIVAFEVDPTDSAWIPGDAIEQTILPVGTPILQTVPVPNVTICETTSTANGVTLPGVTFKLNQTLAVGDDDFKIAHGHTAGATLVSENLATAKHVQSGFVMLAADYTTSSLKMYLASGNPFSLRGSSTSGGSNIVDEDLMTSTVAAGHTFEVVSVDEPDSTWIFEITNVEKAQQFTNGASIIKLDGVFQSQIAPGQDEDYQAFYELSLNNGSGGPSADIQAASIPRGLSSHNVTPLLPDTDYVARFRNSFGGRVSTWTDWRAFTTSAVFESQVPVTVKTELTLLREMVDYLFAYNPFRVESRTRQQLKDALSQSAASPFTEAISTAFYPATGFTLATANYDAPDLQATITDGLDITLEGARASAGSPVTDEAAFATAIKVGQHLHVTFAAYPSDLWVYKIKSIVLSQTGASNSADFEFTGEIIGVVV